MNKKEIFAEYKVLRCWLNLLTQVALAWSVSQAQELLKKQQNLS